MCCWYEFLPRVSTTNCIHFVRTSSSVSCVEWLGRTSIPQSADVALTWKLLPSKLLSLVCIFTQILIDRQLFYWLWPKILQNQLNKFAEYWNNHRIHTQKDKPNMSGSTPRHGFMVPAPPAEDCCIIVDQAVINALHAQISISWEESICWVDASFKVVAGNAYKAVGRPCLDTPQSGWAIFSFMVHSLNVASSSTWTFNYIFSVGSHSFGWEYIVKDLLK